MTALSSLFDRLPPESVAVRITVGRAWVQDHFDPTTRKAVVSQVYFAWVEQSSGRANTPEEAISMAIDAFVKKKAKAAKQKRSKRK